MPSSAMTCTTAGLMVSAGALPADRTWTCRPERQRSSPAAICERPALCTHTNRTSIMARKLATHVIPPSCRATPLVTVTLLTVPVQVREWGIDMKLVAYLRVSTDRQADEGFG